MTGSAARAQEVQVQLRRPSDSMVRAHVKRKRSAEAGRPQTAQQVLEVMSMTVVRHRVGPATDARQSWNKSPACRYGWGTFRRPFRCVPVGTRPVTRGRLD